MYAYEGCGCRSGLGSYAEPWDAPSITGQLQVTTDQLRFSVPGYNFALQWAADPATRAAFEAYSFGDAITIHGKKAAYGLYIVESWEGPAGSGSGGGTPPTNGGTTPPTNGGTTPPAGGGGTTTAAAIPWTPILAGLGLLLLAFPRRRASS